MKPFFVGWMGLPRGLRLFMGMVLATLAIIDVGLAAGLYLAQPPRQTGLWDASGEQEVRGVLVTEPYPMIRVAATDKAPAALVLLADEWKFGLPLGPGFHDGDLMRVTGYAIRRGDVTVLQVDNKLQRLGRAAPAPALLPGGERTLSGEIVDSKCWTGAMNPGEGKTHKGCGSLCLLGGIPALFIASGADGVTRWYVIADEEGRSLGEDIRARIGERLTLTGQVLAASDLHEFRVSAAALASN
jgi:hypothetical protein